MSFAAPMAVEHALRTMRRVDYPGNGEELSGTKYPRLCVMVCDQIFTTP